MCFFKEIILFRFRSYITKAKVILNINMFGYIYIFILIIINYYYYYFIQTII